MENDEAQLKKRFQELSYRASLRSCTVYSDFLTLDEQSVLKETRLDSPFCLYGGYDFAERKIACFGNENDCEKTFSYDGVWVKIYPVSPKFAEDLSHRDFLGTLMGLGIRRETLGDIILDENCGYIFCESKIAQYIVENVDRVRHTVVKCAAVDSAPESGTELPEKQMVIVASERLDAIVAAVYKLSRAQSQQLFMQKMVFVNGKMTVNSSYLPKNGEIISVRHHGRFIFCEVSGETKKSRLKVNVRIF